MERLIKPRKKNSRNLNSQEKFGGKKLKYITKARKVHGDKYNYDNMNYKGTTSIIKIGCPRHLDFEITASIHLKGTGCPDCLKESKGDAFIEEAKVVHGDKYDYSKVKFNTVDTKVIIICKEHGEFEQTPVCHLQGQGCSMCAGNKKKTEKEFLADARAVHGDTYAYEDIAYVNMSTDIEIICSKHGKFEQTPSNHLEGSGCPQCALNRKKTNEEFIEDARAVHGDTYSYDNVVYINTNTKVPITCKKHGDFTQKPFNHLQGQGCPKCAGNEKKTTAQFILEAKATHGDRYGYSSVEYINAREKVAIKCKIHGIFYQLPNVHTNGSGCSKCTKGSRRRK